MKFTNKHATIIGLILLALSAYWYVYSKNEKNFPGKYFYMAEGALIYSTIAGVLGVSFLFGGLTTTADNKYVWES